MVELPTPLEDLICSHEDLVLQEVVGLRLHLIAFYGKQHVYESNIRYLAMIVQPEAVHVHVPKNYVLLVQVPQHRNDLANYL